jgi:hypothetical protein
MVEYDNFAVIIEPQNTESARGGNVEVLKIYYTSSFDISASGGFDIRYSILH